MEEFIGKKIGNYQIERLLSSSKLGGVYLAKQPLTDRFVAIKILSPAFRLIPGLTEHFLLEAKAVADIRHKNVINIFDFGLTDDGICYSVMEYLHGQTLSDITAKHCQMDLNQVGT